MGRRVAVKGTLGVSHINKNRKKKFYGKYLKSISLTPHGFSLSTRGY